MKSTLLILFVSLVLSASGSFARIGENEEQTDHRYGKPAGKWDDYLGYRKLYHWRGFNVMVTFLNGVSQREMFEKDGVSMDRHTQKSLAKVAGTEKDGVVYDQSAGVFTTKGFEEKYIAARTAAWAKDAEKH